MSRWSPTTRGGMPNPHEGIADGIRSVGQMVGQQMQRREANARRAWEDELEGRRYADTQDRLARTEARMLAKERADQIRQGALDAANGLLQIPEGDDRVHNAMLSYDPVTGEEMHVPEYKPLGGGYYQDARRTPEYTEGLTRNRNRRIGELAGGEGSGIDPELAAELGPGYVQSTLIQRQGQEFTEGQAQANREHAERMARLTASLRPPPASGGPGRTAPMSIVSALGEVDTLYGLTQSIAEMTTSNPESVGGVGFLPGAVQSWATGPDGPNAFGRALSALPGISPESFGPNQTAVRAMIADLKSRLLLARSGAAVTPSEYERLIAMLPSDSEPPEVIRAKVAQMGALLEEKARFLRANYGENQGYFPMETQHVPGQMPAGGAQGGGAAPDPTGGFFSRFNVQR